jgi:hypothetical protein
LNALKWPTPPFYNVLNLVVKLFLFKSVRFAIYMTFGVFVFDGHFDVIRVFFRYLEMSYPPIFKCSKSNDVKKFLYTITIWKIWGGLTFQSLVDFSWAVTEFECLDSAVHNVDWGYQKPKKVHSQCHCGDEDYTSSV